MNNIAKVMDYFADFSKLQQLYCAWKYMRLKK